MATLHGITLHEDTEDDTLIYEMLRAQTKIEPLLPEVVGTIGGYTSGLTNLPSGSLLVDKRGEWLGGEIVVWNNNDTNNHTALFFWMKSVGGRDKLTMYHEEGSRPVSFGVRIPFGRKASNPTIMSDFAQEPEFGCVAYHPRKEFLEHPRYLEVLERFLICYHNIAVMNAFTYSCLTRYFTNLLTTPSKVENGKRYSSAVNVCRTMMKTMERENRIDFEHVLRESLKSPKMMSIVCVDVCVDMMELITEELFVNIRPEELASGIQPKPPINVKNRNYITPAIMLASGSECFKYFEPNESPVYTSIHIPPSCPIIGLIQLLPYVIVGVIVLIILILKKPLFALFRPRT